MCQVTQPDNTSGNEVFGFFQDPLGNTFFFAGILDRLKVLWWLMKQVGPPQSLAGSPSSPPRHQAALHVHMMEA